MLSGLRRTGRLERKTLSALRPARGQVAWIFLPRILGRVVADGGGIDWLFFLRWVSDAEPDALRNAGRGCGLFQLPKTRRGLRCSPREAPFTWPPREAKTFTRSQSA